MSGDPAAAPEAFWGALEKAFPVPRETAVSLETYVKTLLEWQRGINLISPSTTADIWMRHILDSAQVMKFLPQNYSALCDIGSGAGLPGIVLAISGAKNVLLFESDRRKAAFLNHVIVTLKLKAKVVTERFENFNSEDKNFSNCVFTARAVAGLDKLLDYVLAFAVKNQVSEATMLFLKGRKAAEELEEARRGREFDCCLHPSVTDSRSCVIEIKNLRRGK